MAQNLDKYTKETRVVPATVVGTTNINGSVLDMEGFEGVEFILQGGTVTDGNLSIKAQSDTVVGMGTAADLTGTLTTINNAANAKAAVLDVFRPVKRFVRCVVVRGGATGAVIDSVMAIQYGGRNLPVANDATSVVASKTVISPADGVA
jgi:hypothetical protein